MILNTNVQSLTANNCLWHKNNDLTKSSTKLSSGISINKVGDDASGMAIANKMRRQIQGLESANQNTTDGISLIATAEGGLAEIQNIIQRVRELAIQGATDTVTDNDRLLIEEEALQLIDEIDAIVEKVEFNSKSLLNDDHEIFKFQVGTRSGDELHLEMPRINSVDLFVNYDDVYCDAEGIVIFETVGYDMNTSGQYVDPNEATVVVDTTIAGVQNPDGTNPSITADGSPFNSNTDPLLLLDGTYKLPDGSIVDIYQDQYAMNDLGQYVDLNTAPVIFDPNAFIDDAGTLLPTLREGMTLTSIEGCTAALKRCDYALMLSSQYRATLGVTQNRLEQTNNTLINAEESTRVALSAVIDTDMAGEMATYTKENVLVQAGISMLAQSNQRPNQILTLLQ